MTHLLVEYLHPGWRADQIAAPPDDARRLGNAREQWRKDVWQPYAGKKVHRTAHVHSFACGIGAHGGGAPLDVDALELPLDEQLFDSLLDLFATYGWPGLAAAWAQRRPLSGYDQLFLARSMACLDELLRRELVAIQGVATRLAMEENAALTRGVAGALAKFRQNTGYNSVELDINKDALFPKLLECRRLQRRIAGQQKAVDERFRKDGGDAGTVDARRERDAYRRILADLAEAPYQASLTRLQELQEDIAEVFAPALLILDELEDDLEDWLSLADAARTQSAVRRRRSREVELGYDRKMHRMLVGLRDGMGDIRTSLSNPGADSALFRRTELGDAERLALGGVTSAALDFALEQRPGIAAFVRDGVVHGLFGLYFTHEQRQAHSQANRVLGCPRVLRRLLDAVEQDLPGSLRQVVLKHHCLELEARLEASREDKAFMDSLWHALEVVAAAAGLLLAVLSIPFGAGAVGVPAALAAFLTVLGLATAVLGVVLMAGSVLQLMQRKLEADDELSRALLRLGLLDAAALAELGTMLSNHHALARAAGPGMMLELVKLAAAHRLRPVAFALDMEGFLDDVETLTAAE
jgi:hypothetical protein